MFNIIRSFLFFLSTLIRKKKYDVIFYYPQHFNRSLDGENVFFKDLLLTCVNNRISYVIFEEPDFTTSSKRSSVAIPFDFLYLLIVFLRKIYGVSLSPVLKDQKIGRIINKLFFRRIHFKKYITISQSMLSIFRGIREDVELYDLQHGIIYNNKKNYLVNGIADDNLVLNDTRLLVNGKGYKDLLISNDRSDYFKTHTFILGSHIFSSKISHVNFNNKILITLQFTRDHSEQENNILLEELETFILSLEGVMFYLKHHPRFNNEVDLSNIFSLPNVCSAPIDLNECFEVCSLHATFYSSCVFDAAISGIPTVFINSIINFNMFSDDFGYPFSNSVSDFRDLIVYQESSRVVQEWASKYYMSFNQSDFIKLMK